MDTQELDYHKLVSLSADIGALMLRNGAEIYRVETSVGAILSAYGRRENCVFAIPSFLLVSIKDDKDQPITQGVRICYRTTDLVKIDSLNHLCRQISAQKLDLSSVGAEIDRIRAIHTYSPLLQILMSGMIGCAFTLF